jgi:hypothetical protein
MDYLQKIYVLGKQKQIVEHKVVNFVKNMTDVQKMALSANEMVGLVEKSKQLLVYLGQWEERVLKSLSEKKLTLKDVTEACWELEKLERLYYYYSSEYNEILQRLICYKN